MPPSPTKKTPKKNKSMNLPRKGSLTLQDATVEKSPLGTKTFNLTLGAGDDYDTGKSPRFDNQAGSPDFSAGRRDPKAAAAEQAKLVAEMLGQEVSAGDIAARYEMSDSSDDELDELMAESKAKATDESQDAKFTGDFDWNSQMGPMVETLQKENSTMKVELDKKKQQVKKLGIMLNALEPIPGVDAEKLLSVLDEKGEPVHSDMRDVKIIQLSKKVRNLQFELNKQKNMNKNAEEAILQLDQELEKKQAEIDTLATPQARAAIMKTMVGGIGALENDPNFGTTGGGGGSNRQTKELQKQLDDMRHKFEILKEKNRVLEHKLIQEVGGEGPASEKMSKIMGEGWKGRAQQITLLKTKMKRLEANAKTGGMMESRGSSRSTTAQQRVAANNLRRDVDFKAQQELNEMEKMRQQGVEQLSKAYEEMKDKLERTEKRYASAKVRVGCLEQDNAKMRDGMKVFVGKASNDDKLVDMLKQEAQELRKKLKRNQERETKMQGERETMRGEGKEVELLKAQLSQFKNQNSHQERIINQLRADMHRMRNPGSSNKKAPGPRRTVDAVGLSENERPNVLDRK